MFSCRLAEVPESARGDIACGPIAETCPAGAPTTAEMAPFQLSSMLKRIEFLTAEGYAPSLAATCRKAEC